jgi:hypothetical protein
MAEKVILKTDFMKKVASSNLGMCECQHGVTFQVLPWKHWTTRNQGDQIGQFFVNWATFGSL